MGGFASGGDTVVVMPMWKRATITGVQLLMTLITAGVIIGYGQLYPMLVDAGVYKDKCSGYNYHSSNSTSATTCPLQETALDQLFNVGASVSIFVQAPSGIVLDFLGPRITCWMGLALFIPGCFLFAYAKVIHAIDAYMFGFQLLAAGGPFVFISTMPVAQLWPDKKAMILMMVNGLYGGGAFVFFLFRLLNVQANISMQDLFIAYGILGCFIVVVALFFWPRHSFAKEGKTKGEADPGPSLTPLELLSKSFRDITTIHYVYLALAIAFLVFKSNYFLSTSDQQFSRLLSGDKLSQWNSIFGVVLPAIGMLAGPIGILFDKFGENVALILLIGLSSISSLCGMITNVSESTFGVLQIIRMFVFSAYYPMIYGVWAFFIIKKFGSENFGVLYGCIAILAGVVNLAASDPMVDFSLAKENGSFFMANLILVSIGAVFAVYPIAMIIRNRIYRRSSHGSGYYEPIGINN